ncbi:zf-CCHC domain-containing protein, partial [Tanacetum coccineum]
RNHVRKFLRVLPTKWHPKVTAIEESKDLSTLPLDELIGNLKVYEVVLEKDSEISKKKKEKYKSLALKARKVLSKEEASSLDSENEEYAMAVRDFKKFFRRRGKFVRQPHDDKKNFQKVKEDKKEKEDRSDSEDDSKKEEICLMALDNNEVRLKVKLEADEWIKDSQCSRHMTCNKDLFSSYKSIDRGDLYKLLLVQNMAAPTIPISAEKNLGYPIDIRVDIIHLEPVTAVAFPVASVVRIQAQHGEDIRGIHEYLQGVPIEAENASLRVQESQRQDQESFKKLQELVTSQLRRHP